MRIVSAILTISLALMQPALAGQLYSGIQVAPLPSVAPSEKAYRTSPSLQRKYVKTYEDYVDHNRSHVEKVRKLAVAAVKAHPEIFPGVDPDLLDLYASWHDMEKFLDKFSPRLYAAYGKQFKTATGEAIPGLEEHFKMMNELNAMGDKFEHQFFMKHNVGNRFIAPDGKYTPLAKLYQIAVKAADRGDRALSEVSPEEFGKRMESVGEYAKKNPGLISDTEVKIAEYFEGPVSEHERIEYLQKLVSPTQSLEDLKRRYKTISRYDVITHGSSLKEYQFRRKQAAVTMCLVKSIARSPELRLH